MTEGKIISGKKISDQIREELLQEVQNLKQKNIDPCLAVILVGEDPASAVYVNNKKISCEKIGIKSIVHTLPTETTQEDLLSLVKTLNNDESIHGILCQVPLPPQCNESEIILSIDKDKDVDCFHPFNVGLLATGQPKFMPCTPYGVLQILQREGISTKGKKVVVIGRSNIVGRPLSILLSSKGWDATVTLCHSKTENLEKVCRDADIVIAAIGKSEFITSKFLKKGAIVIDVGTNRVEAPETKKGYRLAGDVLLDDCLSTVKGITPVPGGVGPMTITMLLFNTINAARLANNLELFSLK